LLAGLKTDQRRAWVRRRAELAAIDVAPSPLAQIDPKNLDDGHACAYLWLANGVLLRRLLNDTGRERVLVIDGEEISDHPDETLKEVAAWFGLAAKNSDLRQTSVHYSKNPAQTFTHEDRQTELAVLYDNLRLEVDGAMTWASSRAADFGLDPLSGKMLAD
jgi:hypothetical protein